MPDASRHDAWAAGEAYERYMGGWSRAIARELLSWLDLPSGLDWLDVGCGTGALAGTILERGGPRSVLGVDRSEGFVAWARRSLSDPRARFEVAGAEALPCADRSFDAVASALVYNFLPDRARALSEMRRVSRPGATISFYVWDYPGGGMGAIAAFWRAAAAIDPAAAALAEDLRFPFCTREALLGEALAGGLAGASVEALEVPARFPDFEAFWEPFGLGAGPAPGYYASLGEEARGALEARLRSDLGEGPIELPARAWAVRGGAG